jgi:hypothetical protein
MTTEESWALRGLLAGLALGAAGMATFCTTGLGQLFLIWAGGLNQIQRNRLRRALLHSAGDLVTV